MKKLSVLLALAFLVSLPSQASLHIYGLYMADVSVHEDGNRYYQDTMFKDFRPVDAFNGCVDVMVLKGWYCFGNTFDYAPVDDNVIDKGQKAIYVDRGTCSGVKVKCLDPEVYPVLNPVTGQEATANSPQSFISSADMRRTLLFNNAILEEGTNYFTIVCPQANELMYSAMIGLYLVDTTNGWSVSLMPKEGTAPDLCAKEAGSGTQDMEGESVCGAPNPRKDASYFFPSNVKMDHPTLFCVKGDLRISIPFFYLAGSNSIEVNEDGLTSPSSVSWVTEGKVDPDWALRQDPGNEIAYLAIVVEKSAPQPKLSTPSIVIPPASNDGFLMLENLGAGSFTYSASTTSTWLTIDSKATSGTVTLQQKIPVTVNKTGFRPGSYVSFVDFEIEGYGKATAKVTMVVEEPKTGAVRLKGLYLLSNTGNPPYYQDTMIRSITPAYSFDGGCMDILLANGIYVFGNDALLDFCREAEYLLENMLDRNTPAAYVPCGSFGGTNIVHRLDPQKYELVNQAIDNDDDPDAADAGEYVKLSGLTKKVLDCYLQVGTNRFTLVLPEAGEFSSDEFQLGLFLGETVQSGAVPDLAANDNELFFDAEDYPYATYTTEDRKYHYAIVPDDTFKKSTLTCDKGDYHLELTKFFILGVNDGFMNPMGMTSPAAPGYVATGGDSNNAWPVHASPETALGYFEVVVTGVPEPCALLLSALALLLFLRRK